MNARAILGAAILLLPLAGCLAPAATDEAVRIPLPILGARATYEVEGALVDFWRWENGRALPAGPAEVVLSIGESPPALDGYRVPHEGVRVEVALGGALLREMRVDRDRNAIVQAWMSINNIEKILAFDERGYPWAWGASLLQGRDLRAGDVVPLALPGNGGDGPPETRGMGAPLALALRVARAENGLARLDLEGNASVDWTLWMRDGSPWPERVEVTWRAPGLAPYVRVALATDFTMRARLVGEATGAQPIPFGDRAAGWVTEQTGAERDGWTGGPPPDGGDRYVPFLLGEAVEFATTTDVGLSQFLAGSRDARLSRATYFRGPGLADGTSAHSWLLQYVSPLGVFYEARVNRTIADALGVPLVTRVESSGPVPPPAGGHGWFPREALPPDLLTIGAGVAIVKEIFGAPDVQIFVRSFVDPPGYGYYIDGGFETPGGRYTVIVNAQNGFVQAAVGPVSPVLAGT